jgi:TQXA domain-containing protein/LPXTG-motif cell wall-anchored protein
VFSVRKLVRWRSVAAVTLVGAVAALIGSSPALADPGVIAQPGVSADYGLVRLDGFAKPVEVGALFLKFGAEKVPAYCIDLHNPVALNKDYQEGAWTEADVKNLGKIQWVLLHGYPKGDTATLLADSAADAKGIDASRVSELLYVATQTSVWHFSDGAVLSDTAVQQRGGFRPNEYALVKAVYDYLTKNATDAPEPQATLSIAPATASAKAGEKAGPFTVTGPSGDIVLKVDGGTAVDAAGHSLTTVTNGGRFWLTRDGSGDVSVTAEAKASHSTGRVFLYQGTERRQKLILAGTAGEELSAGAKASFTKPESTPTPTPTATATPTPSATPSSPAATPSATTPAPATGSGGGGGTLPLTGSSTIVVIGAGILLLVAGAAAVFFVRRRRLNFTA